MADADLFEQFAVGVSDEAVFDLRRRLADTRWPDQVVDTGWDDGCNLAWLRNLADYWADGFDWRSAEARINSFNQVTTTIDGQRIHAIHQRSPEPDALPLLISHGWPGSIVEFLQVLGPLTDPAAHGGEPGDAFPVIAPSLKPRSRPSVRRAAAAASLLASAPTSARSTGPPRCTHSTPRSSG